MLMIFFIVKGHLLSHQDSEDTVMSELLILLANSLTDPINTEY